MEEPLESKQYLAMCVGECFGTFLLVFIGTGPAYVLKIGISSTGGRMFQFQSENRRPQPTIHEHLRAVSIWVCTALLAGPGKALGVPATRSVGRPVRAWRKVDL